VSDFASVLSGDEKSFLENKITAFQKSTTNEIAIVIIKSLDGEPIENLAQEIFTRWGIGDKEKNNGVLILVAVEDRKMRIHTGYGVEGDLPDLATSYIQSDIMAPSFRENNYYAGLDGAVDKIIESLGGVQIMPEEYSNEGKKNIDFSAIFFLGFIVLQWIIAILGRSKSWWGGGVLGAVIGGAVWVFGSLSFIVSLIFLIFFIIFGLGLDFFVSSRYDKIKKMGGHFPWWIGGGGFGGGGSGGGFGGFSGGSSGGGGSSSSW
jgi:uncharacterized protein